MHFEVLVEDQSGKKALDILMPKLVEPPHTFNVHSYKGIGRIPKNLRDPKDASKRILLDNLPRLLKGYGRTFLGRPHYPSAVIVVCDLDAKDKEQFRRELLGMLAACEPQPVTRFCFAVEEGEAWFLGDLTAIRTAYPKVREAVLSAYEQDSICGTWELLANALYPGGAAALTLKGWQAVGAEKSKWAEVISPHMRVDDNRSPSFCYFVGRLRELTGEE